MEKLKITGFRVLIKPDPIEQVSKGGIVTVIEGSMSERREQAGQLKGTVLSVGPTAWKSFDPGPEWKPWAKPGDRVLYTRYGGRYIPDPDDHKKQLVIVNDEDVLGVYED